MSTSPIDAPPHEPPVRASVVRQLEDDDEDESMDEPMMQPMEEPTSTTEDSRLQSSHHAPTHSTSTNSFEPSATDMDGMPGDEEEDGMAPEPSIISTVSAVSSKSSATPKSKSSVSSSSVSRTKPPTPAVNKTTKLSTKPSDSTIAKSTTKPVVKASAKPITKPAPSTSTIPAPSSQSSSAMKPSPTSTPPPIEPPPTEQVTTIHAVLPDTKKRASVKVTKEATETKEAPAQPPAATDATEEPPAKIVKAKKPIGAKPTSTKPATKHPAPSSLAEPVVPVVEPTPEPIVESVSQPDPAPKPAKVKKAAPTPVSVDSPAPKSKSTKSSKALLSPEPTATDEPTPSTLASEFDFDTHSKLSSLTDENRALSQQLAERDAENARMAEALLTLQEELEIAEKSGGINLSKELSKKNREAAVLLNKERAQHAQAIEALKKQHAAAIEELRSTLGSSPQVKSPNHKKAASTPANNFAFGSTAPAPSLAVYEPSSHELEAKLQSLQKNYLEKSNECSSLQAKLKQVSRVLVQEIDPSLKPEEVLDEKYLGKVKGRAQMITKLKDKVRELEKALAAAGGDQQHAPGSPSHERDLTTPTPSVGQEFHENTLKVMAHEKKNELVFLREGYAQMTVELEKGKKKYEALKARNNILETDLKNVRDKVKMLIDKSTSDDTLIDSLNSHIESFKKNLQEKEKEWKLQYGIGEDGVVRRPPSGSTAASVMKQNVDVKLTEQERLIRQLREEVAKLKQAGGTNKTGTAPNHRSTVSNPTTSSSTSAAQQQPNPEQIAKLTDYLRMENDIQLNLQQIENEKLRTMLTNHTTRITELEATLFATQKRNLELENLLPPQLTTATITKQLKATANLGVTTMAPRQPKGASSTRTVTEPPVVDVQTLKNQLQQTLSEQQLIQTSYAATLANKDQDIAILNEILNQKNQLYLANINELRKKVQELTLNK